MPLKKISSATGLNTPATQNSRMTSTVVAGMGTRRYANGSAPIPSKIDKITAAIRPNPADQMSPLRQPSTSPHRVSPTAPAPVLNCRTILIRAAASSTRAIPSATMVCGEYTERTSCNAPSISRIASSDTDRVFSLILPAAIRGPSMRCRHGTEHTSDPIFRLLVASILCGSDFLFSPMR